MLATIPEIILQDVIKKLLAYVRTDYANKVDKEQTILYYLLNDQVLRKYNFFEEAKSVFITKDTDQRHIAVNMMFNRDRQAVPTIHIMLPSENETDMTLGIGEGERLYITDQDDTSLVRKTFNKRFRSNYNIVVTSENANEVILIYHVLRSLLISANPHFNLKGLYNIKLGGRDLQINPDLVPSHIFMKSISFDCEYEVGAIELIPIEYINDFDIEGTAESTIPV